MVTFFVMMHLAARWRQLSKSLRISSSNVRFASFKDPNCTPLNSCPFLSQGTDENHMVINQDCKAHGVKVRFENYSILEGIHGFDGLVRCHDGRGHRPQRASLKLCKICVSLTSNRFSILAEIFHINRGRIIGNHYFFPAVLSSFPLTGGLDPFGLHSLAMASLAQDKMHRATFRRRWLCAA